ncbi:MULTISPECIES: DHH family phosphoesterase [Anoxybacillus]|uniref:Bifunctional oligoribonuclease/PAP phosphatase NrnA n=1 Tax=Anoxybacillus flavithermus TaxID=33934 RepID=A0A178T4T2_9BACL|nr:bifunctional oligoribonuclease/PAP phosphatase NrnA [Anoxybacillus flavithermus]ASA97680.1 bifunctional oligoribonuclease/PAP phosphatase NrnA [Anoxybacillus flavithermus]ELK22820.1 bifunctional oligoribonuclease and PAP phosphatase NrnA [Anoxybacillus flavithermus TNO-09.006]MBE2906239.1 bifunctional oligoribonuclease/PAP phosphatase NrnA [Anoxybacillus flavithermus]MBE2908405.1 bifunctional oligoribonuclease/PAP phosphatase NrnA [Anoxybacillus flavithermus]MBE2911479.1 bifunctional oligor
MEQKVLEIIDHIRQFDTIIIHRHVRPDPDAYGSQGGLAELIQASFPEKRVYTVGKDEPSLEFLRKMDVVPDEMYNDALVIVCDTANEERVCDQRYKLGKKIIKIDHHPNEDPYGDILWVDTNASSVSEMIYELYLIGKEHGLILTKEAARLIYAGIVGDTGRFLFPSTNPKTFKYASELVEYGFSFVDLYDQLYRTKLSIAHLSGYVLQNFELSEYGVAHIVLTKELLKQYDATPSEASQLVSVLGNIEGIKAWVFFVEEDDQIRVRLRSRGPIVNEVAKKYRGGGHPLAAGASIYSWEEVKRVLADLNEVCKQQ